MLRGGDHGLFYFLDIVITNNKKDRPGNCTNGQDLGGCNQVSDERGKNCTDGGGGWREDPRVGRMELGIRKRPVCPGSP